MERIYRGLDPHGEEVARTTAGISHDWNNVLLAILGCIDLMKQKAGTGIYPFKALLRDLNSLEKAAETGKEIANRLNDVLLTNLERSLLAQKRKRALNLNDIVRDVVELQRHKFHNGVALSVKLTPDLWPVEGDEVNIERLLINLVENAHAATQKGSINISSENVCLTEQGKCFVCISVQDTGKGIAPALIANIFKPLYTTKGRGHGMGMPVVKQVAEDHGGWIEIDSDSGKGTQIKAYFPASAPQKPLVACGRSN